MSNVGCDRQQTTGSFFLETIVFLILYSCSFCLEKGMPADGWGSVGWDAKYFGKVWLWNEGKEKNKVGVGILRQRGRARTAWSVEHGGGAGVWFER